MKAKIIRADYQNEWESKYGLVYNHRIEYDDKSAMYTSKKKEQTHFVVGQECEFVEQEIITKNGTMIKVKPPTAQGKFSGYHKDLKREQSKYSGFAMSYAKDLVIAEKIPFEQMLPACTKMFNYMVELDKQTES